MEECFLLAYSLGIDCSASFLIDQDHHPTRDTAQNELGLPISFASQEMNK